ncbi:MAG: hypothetical protein ABF335_03095 [Alphaproteobacteria bacterium]
MSDFQKHVDADCRLVILRALEDQHDGRLNESLLEQALENLGHRVSRERVRRYMQDLEEAGAIAIQKFADIFVGEITARGQDHLERAIKIDAVAVPSRTK